MDDGGLARGLIAWVQREAAEPGGRTRIAAALREALAHVEPAAETVMETLAPALADLSASLTQAADHAEFIAERAAWLTMRPPQGRR